jgi:hypothetical protein
MILVKSILTGLAALVLTAILMLVGWMVRVSMVMRKPRDRTVTIGIDPVSVFKSSPGLWIIAMIVFALGFYWEYRRAASGGG